MKDEDWVIIKTLYDNPNLTKAANLLYISQPALTKRLQQIEQQFDAVLAIRGTKGVVFTPQGEYLAKKSHEYIKLLQETKRQMTALGQGNIGNLKIGAPNSYARFSLPVTLKHYGSLFQGINFKVTVAHSSEIVKYVQSGLIHIGFLRGDHKHGEQQYCITSDRAFIISSRPLRLDELPGVPFIRHSMDAATQRLIDTWWASHFDQPPHVGIDVGDVDTCREMVANGLGFGVFFSDYLHTCGHLQRLSMLNSDGTPIERNTWMIYKEELYGNTLIKNFVDFVKSNYSVSNSVE